jgi:hypothetical protein
VKFPLDNRVPDQSLGSQLEQCDQRAAFRAARTAVESRTLWHQSARMGVDDSGRFVSLNASTFRRVTIARWENPLLVLTMPGMLETLFGCTSTEAESPADRLILESQGAISWAGIKRRWVPYRLWVWTSANRWLGRSRFVCWLLNRTTWRCP